MNNGFTGLPKQDNTHLANIHFITCSNEVDCLELVEGFIADLVTLESEGVAVYDAYLDCEVLLIAPVICDNPRAAEITSHNYGKHSQALLQDLHGNIFGISFHLYVAKKV